MTHRRFRTAAIILAALALGACASDQRPSPAASAVPQGTAAYNCPEADPAQLTCRPSLMPGAGIPGREGFDTFLTTAGNGK